MVDLTSTEMKEWMRRSDQEIADILIAKTEEFNRMLSIANFKGLMVIVEQDDIREISQSFGRPYLRTKIYKDLRDEKNSIPNNR